MIFCTFTNIDETHTPSLDILKEYENRFLVDPIIEIKREKALQKKQLKKQLRFGKSPLPTSADRTHGISHRDSNLNADFAQHTISSAIKADYTESDVQRKIDELNSSVQKIKIVKNAPGSKVYRPRSKNSRKSANHKTPFVVKHVEPNLTARRTELHDVLHDGLMLTKKNPNKIFGGRARSRSTGGSRSRSLSGNRQARSLSPQFPRPYSFNESLNDENDRSQGHYVDVGRSRSGSAGRSRPDYSHQKYQGSRSGSPSACEVFYDHHIKQNLTAYNRIDNVKLYSI